MKMRKITSFLLLALLLVAGACSRSAAPFAEEPEVPALDPEIISGSATEPFGATEGTLDDAPGNTLTAYVYATRLDEEQGYVSYGADYRVAAGYMQFVSAATAQDGKYPIAPVGFSTEEPEGSGTFIPAPQYYPGQDVLYMAGLVPGAPRRWTFDTAGEVISCSIDGRTDIMVGIATTMNDGVKPIKKSNASATTYPVFNFKHKLTLVRVRVYCPTASDVNAWGKITGIRCVAAAGVAAGVHTTLDVTLEDGTGTPTGAAAATTTPFYYYGALQGGATLYSGLALSTAADSLADSSRNYGPVAIPAPATAEVPDFTAANAAYIGYSMIAPFTAIAGRNLTLVIYSERNPQGVTAPVSALYTDAALTTPYLGSTEGKRFDVTLKLTGMEVTAAATITDWVEIYAGQIVL